MKAALTIKKFTAEETAKVVGGRLEIYGGGAPGEITNIVYDSRDVSAGSLFCAIRGERADGHNYIAKAVEAGAVAVLAEEVPEAAKSCGDFAAIITPNPVEALGVLSGYYRSFSRAKVIAVTGSVGKTTTKDFIASVAKTAFRTMKTEGNHNNEIGLPMTLFSLTPECEVAVLEMGMSNLGEISFMTRLARPDVAVITNIGASHLESLGSRENICRAKLEIAEGMTSDGILLMNGDEPLLTDKKDSLVPQTKYMGVYNKNADYKAMNIRVGEEKTVFDILYDGRAVINVEIPVLGRHNVYNAVAAYFAGVTLGMSEEEIRKGLLSFEGTEMRQTIYPLGNITVIEDCYNASPESMRAALEVLCAKSKSGSGAPCALLGTMLELGENSRLMHDQLGQYAAQMKVQKLYCYGDMAETVAEAAIKKGIRADNVFVCTDSAKPDVMARMIKDSVGDGDTLLVKASRGVAAEKVIEELKRLYSFKKKKK